MTSSAVAISLIDSHCHVAEAEYDTDRAAVLARAREAGIVTMIVVAAGGTLDTNVRALELCARETDCHPVVGVHPHDARLVNDTVFDEIAELASRPGVVAIGETGLDFHYDHSPRETQVELFRRFIRLARTLDLPLVVHSREAARETIDVLREERAGRGVFHCFTYGADVVRSVLELGFHVSFSGIVTFRNAEDVREAARAVPGDRLLVETDSPYLAPEPKRGKRNEPARVVDVAAGVARAIGQPLADVAESTVTNTRRLFAL